MTWLLNTVVGAALKAFLDSVVGYFKEKQQRADDRQAGADGAAAETAETTQEIADARAEIASEPNDPDTVADWLRAEADRAESGGGGTEGN